MSASIGVVIPWFGRWEPWTPLFFETVRRNPTLDFLVYTDAPTEGLEAPNVAFHPTTFAGYVERIQRVLGPSFRPPDPYKLCDYRPLLGRVHQAELVGYDFYGWCDVDLLFGDIRSFYTDDVLDRHDVLSTHDDRISGHFALFRNDARNRSMYRRIYAWEDALRNPEFVGIDEWGITNAYLMTPFDRLNEKFQWSVANPLTRAWSAARRRRMYMREQYTTPFQPRPWLDGSTHSDQPSTWFYRDGRLTNARDGDRAFLYLHLMNFKSSRWRHDGTRAPWEGLADPCRAAPSDMTAGIVIDEHGIRPLGGDAP